MDKAEVLSRVVKVVSEVLNVPVSDIKPEHRFTTDLGAESIQSVELVAGFEEEFEIEMPEDEALKVQSVGDAADFIASLVD